MTYKETIENDEIRPLPLLEFSGEIILIDDLDGQESAARALRKEKSVGFDTESRPSFRKGVIYPVALLQLSTVDKAYLIKVKGVGISDAILDILEDSDIAKIGVAINDDIKDLNKINHFKPGGFIALEQFVKVAGIQSNGLRKLAAIILGGRISKGAQVSNWAAAELSQKQLIYAATDAWVSLMMFNQLQDEGFDYDRA